MAWSPAQPLALIAAKRPCENQLHYELRGAQMEAMFKNCNPGLARRMQHENAFHLQARRPSKSLRDTWAALRVKFLSVYIVRPCGY